MAICTSRLAVFLTIFYITTFDSAAALATAKVDENGPKEMMRSFLRHNSKKEKNWLEEFLSRDARPWKPVNQSEDRPNLCSDGKLLPELYVLGAPKSSSTSLAFDLMAAGIRSVHDKENVKEFHFFDGMMQWDWKNKDEMDVQRKRWLDWMPPCPDANNAAASSKTGRPTSAHPLLADFTPDSMRLVGTPWNSQYYKDMHDGQSLYGGRWGRYPPWNQGGDGTVYSLGAVPSNGATWEVSMPPVLRHFYGGDNNADKIPLMAVIREPLARMQSAWYHAQSFQFMNECEDCRAQNFRAAFDTHIGRAQEDPPMWSDWLWTGMYGLQLESWMSHFKPNKLFVVPLGYLQHSGKDSICLEMVDKFNFAMDCDSKGVALSHEWSHPHPTLDEDVTPEMRRIFDEVMAEDKQRLVEVLATAQMGGATLGGFNGTAGSQDDIRDWLDQGW